MAVVAIVSDSADKFAAMERALDLAGLRAALQSAQAASGLSPEQFRIFIKPDMTFFFRPATTMTDPALVEHLIDWLQDAGYANVAMGTSRDGSEFWLENRDPLILADLAGYRYETPKGRGYEVVNLSDDLAAADFPPGSALKGTELSRAWMDAHFRITFGKCKTDEEFTYSGAIQNLLGVLPMRDKDLYYNHRVRAEDACSDLLHLTPVHFAVVDAYVANGGNAGARYGSPVFCSTIIASSNGALTDWTMAIKMGLDPYRSPVVARILRDDGLPEKPQVMGDLAPFPGFPNVYPMVADAVRKRNESVDVQRTATAWLQTVDRELFPFRDAFTDRMNALLAFQFGALDGNPASFATFLALNYSLAAMVQALDATKVMFAKDQLRWMERPLNLRLEDYSQADYVASQVYMEPLEQLVLQLSPDANGMRWQYIDRSVLFHFSRTLPVRFADFVERVDIAKSVRMMNDYIGGACVPVVRDEEGRVTHQAERNIYLPQPNYIVFTGGKPIDVSKLEFITYSGIEHKIFWRTIKSENDTGRFDDGIVAFTKVSEEETMVSVIGRQEFVLPPFWQLLNLDLNPLVKDHLVADAYRNFFTKTMANFEANFAGMEHRIGQPWPEFSEDVPAPALASETIAAGVKNLAEKARVEIDRLTGKFSFTSPKPNPTFVDENGFLHFEARPEPPPGETTDKRAPTLQAAASASLSFLRDLADAVGRDLTARSDKESGN